MTETFNLNVEIRDLPIEANKVLDIIARLRGIRKRDVIRQALVEFADRHQKEFLHLLKESRR